MKTVEELSGRGIVYSLNGIHETNLMPVVSAFQPDKIPYLLCGILKPIKTTELQSIINNSFSKEISSPEISESVSEEEV